MTTHPIASSADYDFAGLATALRSQTQADDEGSVVIVSRQACDEAAAIIEHLAASPQLPVADQVTLRCCGNMIKQAGNTVCCGEPIEVQAFPSAPDVLLHMSKYWEHQWHDGDQHLVRISREKLEEGICALLAAPPTQAIAVEAWHPIDTAPEGELVVCMWLDKEDDEHPARYNFDYFEDGIWMNYFSEHEHYAIAGAATGRSDDAPYTHWTPLPAAPSQGAKQ